MKPYRGVIQGKTIILERKPDLPDGGEALVTLMPLDTKDSEEIVQQQLKFLEEATRIGRILIKSREDIYER